MRPVIYCSVILFALCALLLGSCAVRKAPGGGPADKTPPEVVHTFPKADSTDITALPYLEIEFQENLDRTSLRNQVWLLPEVPGGIELQWKGGKKLRCLLQDSLDQDQTYILTLGTGIKDLRGNKLAAPFVLPFSTGPVIDRGEISGRVVGEKVEDVFIYAYPLDSLSSDTLLRQKPRYYTQVEKGGEFRIQYLKPARYRVFALKDENGDRRYSFQTDLIGVPFTDVALKSESPLFRNLNFSLTREDTSSAGLVRAVPAHRRMLEVILSEPLQLEQSARIAILDSAQNAPLGVLGSEIDPADPAIVRVYTAPQNETVYTGQIRGLRDVAGNPLPEAGLPFRFRGKTREDTTRFRLSRVKPSARQKNVRYDAALQFEFSQPADTLSLRRGIRLLNADSLEVPGSWELYSLTVPRFIPDSLLHKGSQYLIRIDSAAVRSVFGAALGDTSGTAYYPFDTWLWEDLGEIAGMVRTAKTGWDQVLLEAVAFTGSKESFQAVVRTNSPYQIPFLPEGTYQVTATIDINGNQHFDRGATVPFRYAEPFLIYSDTVKVRKRWTSDGIDFYFSP